MEDSAKLKDGGTIRAGEGLLQAGVQNLSRSFPEPVPERAGSDPEPGPQAP